MSMKLTDYLGDKPFWKVTVRLAVPVALQNVLTSSFQLVDTLMVSRLGDVTLSAVGMAAQWGWMAGLLSFGLCSGMSVFISQYWGIQNLKGIRRVMGLGLLTALLISAAFLGVAFFAPGWVLGLFNSDPAVLDAGCRYLKIVCFSYPAVALTVMTKTEIQELTEEEWSMVHATILEAISHLVDFRKQEGAALEKKFREKIANINSLLEQITPYEKERVEKVKERITDALEKTLSVDYDKNRLEQELIYYIEKLDVNEEKQRLSNHLKYFISTMESGSGQGKKLGFIAQEMGREINTLGSKSNHAEMQKIVVQMKDELEQIKEQVLNVM